MLWSHWVAQNYQHLLYKMKQAWYLSKKLLKMQNFSSTILTAKYMHQKSNTKMIVGPLLIFLVLHIFSVCRQILSLNLYNFFPFCHLPFLWGILKFWLILCLEWDLNLGSSWLLYFNLSALQLRPLGHQFYL